MSRVEISFSSDTVRLHIYGEKLTHPTVVIVTKAHHMPSQAPEKNVGGNSFEFFFLSCNKLKVKKIESRFIFSVAFSCLKGCRLCNNFYVNSNSAQFTQWRNVKPPTRTHMINPESTADTTIKTSKGQVLSIVRNTTSALLFLFWKNAFGTRSAILGAVTIGIKGKSLNCAVCIPSNPKLEQTWRQWINLASSRYRNAVYFRRCRMLDKMVTPTSVCVSWSVIG